jgi:hypothetical protein
VPERSETYVFRGPAIRRLTAEQFVDGISAITGVWQEKQAAKVDVMLVSAHAAPVPSRTRAALANADPLMTALGRPNREQVVTVRTSAATTLQALELENGSTLARTCAAVPNAWLQMRPLTTNAAHRQRCSSARSRGRRLARGARAVRTSCSVRIPRQPASRISSGASRCCQSSRW